MNNGRTHWEGCYKEADHHGCALAYIEKLEREKAALFKDLHELGQAVVAGSVSKHPPIQKYWLDKWDDYMTKRGIEL